MTQNGLLEAKITKKWASMLPNKAGMDKPKYKSELELELFSSKYFFRAGAGAF